MFKTREETTIVEVVYDIICNKCGQSCTEGEYYLEAAEISAKWGYGSWKDGEKHLSHLCESCYDKMAAGFVVPPTIEGR